jgi:hypothetical protein
MNVRRRSASLLVALLALAACAKVNVSDREVLVDQKVPRPGHIYVYDFVGTPGDVPADSSLAGHAAAASSSMTPQQVALNRKIGNEVAIALVEQIAGMGLPAAHATSGTVLVVNDLAIHGTLLTIQEGSAAERVAIGMGEGAAELKVAVEGYQMTPNGLRKLGSGTLDTQASKSPGAAVPLVVAIATKNPLGLIVSTGVSLHGEESGSSTIQGKVQAVAKEIGDQIRPRFEQQGWIPPQSAN